VEVVGVTVFVPEVGTSPMPSMDALVASVVFHVSVTWSPAEMDSGCAEILAVGAGAAGGGVAGGGGGVFFLQPEMATKAKTSKTADRIRAQRFNS